MGRLEPEQAGPARIDWPDPSGHGQGPARAGRAGMLAITLTAGLAPLAEADAAEAEQRPEPGA